jgi:hypothetical protein
MKTYFTKGPWNFYPAARSIESSVQTQIAILKQQTGLHPDADAHLIAAAPEMYESMVTALFIIEGLIKLRVGDSNTHVENELHIARDLLTAAIKKARGEK